jgi:predicted metal-dependent hydrolase
MTTTSSPQSSSTNPAAPPATLPLAAAAAPKVSSAITPRPFDVDLSDVPRHWMGGHPVPTHIANGVNLLFPIGERFFVRSVNAYLDQIEDPQLRADVRAFFSQEGRHAHAHDRFNQVLRDQGYEIDRFLERYERILRGLEKRMPRALRLSTTAAVEHFTAIMAEGAFSSTLIERAAPPMKTLLAWHALEEIEHRAVAFDVLQQVNPSYWLRVAGLAVATTTLAGFWVWAAISLLRQDHAALAAPRWLAGSERPPLVRGVFLRGIRAYLRRGFHPKDAPLDHLAARWMSEHLPEAAAAAAASSAA